MCGGKEGVRGKGRREAPEGKGREGNEGREGDECLGEREGVRRKERRVA